MMEYINQSKYSITISFVLLIIIIMEILQTDQQINIIYNSPYINSMHIVPINYTGGELGNFFFIITDFVINICI